MVTKTQELKAPASLKKYAISLLIFLNLVAAGLHFIYHIEIIKYQGLYQKFLIVTNIMYGFSFLYIAAGVCLGNIYQRHTCIIFNLVWWITNAVIVLFFPPDITTLNLLTKYIPLPFEDMVCVILYFIVQISLSIYLLYITPSPNKVRTE